MAEIINLDRSKQRPKPLPRKAEAPQAFPHNLPLQPTPFIGREHELSEIDKLLNDPSCRLLTLVGPGGIGKTRLALEAVSQRLGDYPNGVWFVPFVGVGSVEHIVPTLADALNFQFYGPGDPKVQILNYLKEKRMLLVLDNFEHLLEGAGLVKEVLGAAPGVKCLVTSREKLKLKEEWVLKVQGLAYPKKGSPEDPIESFSAVQLFLQGARRADSEFKLSSQEKPYLVQVCRAVEGMPLGIELASSWVQGLSLKEIAEEVQRNLSFLSTTQKDVTDRHRSLKAVFEQSWGMLTKEEQRSFRRMAVFHGGFTREAAEKVAGATLPVIAGLIDKSFIRKAPSGRYEVHELMRQFGEEKLKGVSGEREKVQDRHAEYYTEFLRKLEVPAHGDRPMEACQEIGEEIDNVRVSWKWSAERGQDKDIEKSSFTLYRYYGLMGRTEGEQVFSEAECKLGMSKKKSVAYWNLFALHRRFRCIRGDIKDLKEDLQKCVSVFRRSGAQKETAYTLSTLAWVCAQLKEYGEAIKRIQEIQPIVNAFKAPEGGILWAKTNSLMQLGEYHWAQGNLKEGRRFLEECIRVSRQCGDTRNTGWGLLKLGHFYSSAYLNDQRDLAKAKVLCQEGLAILREVGDLYGIRGALGQLSSVHYLLGEHAQAEKLCQEEYALAIEHGEAEDRAFYVKSLGLIAALKGDYREAQELMQESLNPLKAIGNREAIADCLFGLGKASLGLGEFREAKRFLQESLDLNKQINQRWGIVECLIGLAQVACSLGEYEESEEDFNQALRKAMKDGAVFQALDALVGLATLLTKQGEKERALELVALVQNNAGSHKGLQDKAKALYSELEADYPPKAVAAALKRGKSKTLEEVAEEILGEKIEPSAKDTLRVCLLGTPKVLFGDREISEKAWGRKKAKKLFCYLALNQDKTFPCEVLVEAFWPKLPGKRGLDSLYTTISSVRQTLKKETGMEGQVVVLEEGQCGLDPKLDIWLDVEEFESQLKKVRQAGKEEAQKEAGKKALSLWQGRFCEGWYDPWVMEAERNLNEKHLEALRKFGGMCLKSGEFEESIKWFEKALVLDELHEETYRYLMTAYAKTGRKKDLKDALETLKRLLKKELGVAPEEETLELFERLTA